MSRHHLIILCVLGALLGVAWTWKAAPPDGVTTVAPDPRVRWEPYPVGGYGLCNRDTCITIPPGAVLWVPYLVADTVYDDKIS